MIRFLVLALVVFAPYVTAKNKLTISSISNRDDSDVTELITLAYQRIGVSISVIHTPAERSLRLANKGLVDAEMYRVSGIDKEYQNLIRVPVALKTIEIVAVTNNKAINIKQWRDLTPYKIGILRGIKTLEKNTKGMSVTAVSHIPQLFNLLNKGRVDILLSERFYALEQLQKNPLGQAFILNPALETRALYHYIHKKHSPLLAPITEALIEVKNQRQIALNMKNVSE